MVILKPLNSEVMLTICEDIFSIKGFEKFETCKNQ